MIGLFDLSENFLKNYFSNIDDYAIIIDGTEVAFYDMENNCEKVAIVSIWKFLAALLKYAKITNYDFLE